MALHCSFLPQEQYLLRLVDICWPWCMSQHFSIRLYAHAILLRIKMYFEEKGTLIFIPLSFTCSDALVFFFCLEKLEILMLKHPSLMTCLGFTDCATGNVKTNWEKMKASRLLAFHDINILHLPHRFVWACVY